MSDGIPTAADLHSHLVPGVDDGARTLEDALEGVGRMVEAGIGAVVTTPHLEASVTVDPEAMDREMARMDRAWEQLSAAVARAHPDLVFRRGFEVRLDVPELALDDERIRLGGTSFVLVEWPRMQIPPGTEAVIRRIREGGLRPVIAHPERYSGMRDRVAQVGDWRDEGAYQQVNLGSLLGRYGGQARSRALRLLREGLVDVLATDFHGRPHLNLHLEPVSDRLRDVGADEQLLLLTSTNPHRIVRNQEPELVPPLPSDGGFWGRVRDLFHVSSS
ncbi:MAG TPA: CpsB/CapC family capsule biosynthesis tyrosine phosphatase [Longimicrobiales bacterium]|nr:CpsB/CapC family capsule biosynthesis tyrosine phosphatase [Longimicrobiales bacterium]